MDGGTVGTNTCGCARAAVTVAGEISTVVDDVDVMMTGTVTETSDVVVAWVVALSTPFGIVDLREASAVVVTVGALLAGGLEEPEAATELPPSKLWPTNIAMTPKMSAAGKANVGRLHQMRCASTTAMARCSVHP